MDQQQIEIQLKKSIEDGKNAEFIVDKRAKMVVNIKKTLRNDYISTIKYILDRQEVHFGTIRQLMDRMIVTDIDKYFEEDIWKSTSGHGENNLRGLIILINEMSRIDTMDIIMHPDFHRNQWEALLHTRRLPA